MIITYNQAFWFFFHYWVSKMFQTIFLLLFYSQATPQCLFWICTLVKLVTILATILPGFCCFTILMHCLSLEGEWEKKYLLHNAFSGPCWKENKICTRWAFTWIEKAIKPSLKFYPANKYMLKVNNTISTNILENGVKRVQS